MSALVYITDHYLVTVPIISGEIHKVNKEEFDEEVMRLGSTKVDPKFLVEWYGHAIASLVAMSKQKSGIGHIRHRGDAREDDFITHLRAMLPSGIENTKGFATDSLGFKSPEQDCLLFNSQTTFSFAAAGTIEYLPIDSVVSSIEIKSHLSLEELRKAIVNQAKLKTLLYEDPSSFDYSKYPASGNKIFSAIFAYRADYTPEGLAEKLSELSSNVPLPLRVNAVYLLNSGLVLPQRAGYNFRPEDYLEPFERYSAITKMGTLPNSEINALPYLLFLAAIIDHSVSEIRSRRPASCRDYVFRPSQWLAQIWEEMGTDKFLNFLNGK